MWCVLQTQQFRLIYTFPGSHSLTSWAHLETRLKLERVLVLSLVLPYSADNFCYHRDIMLTYPRAWIWMSFPAAAAKHMVVPTQHNHLTQYNPHFNSNQPQNSSSHPHFCLIIPIFFSSLPHYI